MSMFLIKWKDVVMDNRQGSLSSSDWKNGIEQLTTGTSGGPIPLNSIGWGDIGELLANGEAVATYGALGRLSFSLDRDINREVEVWEVSESCVR